MCQIYSNQDPELFASTTRSLRLSGHSTSIRLETAFWKVLDRMARDEGLSMPDFIATLHDEVVQKQGERPANFTSILRSSCLLYLDGAKSSLVAAE